MIVALCVITTTTSCHKRGRCFFKADFKNGFRHIFIELILDKKEDTCDYIARINKKNIALRTKDMYREYLA